MHKSIKFFHILTIIFLTTTIFCAQQEEMQFVVQAKTVEKMGLGIGIVGEIDLKTKTMVDRLQKDLAYSGQLFVCTQRVQEIKNMTEIKAIFDKNIALVLFITPDAMSYSFRLYDLTTGEMMLGKKVLKQDLSQRALGHIIADMVWPSLFGTPGCFGSKIAYCKQVWRKRGGRDKVYKQIWITDFDGTYPQLFIDLPTISIAPRWSVMQDCPILFYSENTLSNIQLVMANMYKNRQVVSRFDGLNMQPAFSVDGKEFVYCLSKDGSSQLYHCYTNPLHHRKEYDRLTNNDGNNLAPCFIDKDHIVFVSDFETKNPQLYSMNVNTKKLELLTDGISYCACPNFCEQNNKLVYSKKIEGVMQLMVYDVVTKTHKQMTKGSGSKEEGSWSCCGNYITYCCNQGCQSRIAQLNLITGKTRYLTGSDEHCTYPSCSPVYSEMIGVLR